MAHSLGLSGDELLHAFAPALIRDIDAVCELRRRGFGPHLTDDKEKIRWRYFSRNPKRSDLLVLKLENKIVAAVGVEPISVRLNGSTYAGVRCADIVVEPALMGKGLGAWMNLYVQDQYPIVMAMGSNQFSASMVNKLFTAMPVRQYLKFPVTGGTYLARKATNINVIRCARFPVDAWLWARRKFYFLRSRIRGYNVRVLDNFDAVKQFAALTDVTDNTMAVRDPAFIQWRYADNVVSEFVPLVLCKHDEVIGYAVLKTDAEGPASQWHLMDWQVQSNHRAKATLKYLMLACVEHAATQGAALVTALLSDELSKSAALDSGFIFRYRDEGFHLWADTTISNDIYSAPLWFLSFADTDEVT